MQRISVALAAFALAALSSAQTIDTYAGWNGSDHITGLGGTNWTTTFGQTFEVGSASILTTYTSALVLDSGTPFNVRFYVAAWDDVNRRASSAPIYASSPFSLPNLASGFQNQTVNPNVALAAGKYVAFYSTIETALSTTSIGGIGTQYTGSTYAGGEHVSTTVETLAELTTTSWFSFSPAAEYDTIFHAELQAVPEPASCAALAMGTLAFLRRRRR